MTPQIITHEGKKYKVIEVIEDFIPNKTIKIGNIEVETKLHSEMNKMGLIKIPKGWRLLTVSEFFDLYNNHFDKFDFKDLDEVIENPSLKARVKFPYWNMWLSRLVNNSSVNGNFRLLNNNNTVRGVRFCRDVKK